MAIHGSIEPQKPEAFEADQTELTRCKADLRTLYRRLKKMGPGCRTKTVRDEVFALLKLYHALPV